MNVNRRTIRAGMSIGVVSIAAALSLSCKLGNSDQVKVENPTIAWGLDGIFDAPEVEAIAFSTLVGAATSSNFGFLEFIQTSYGVIAHVNLNSLEPRSYSVSITDRNICATGVDEFLPAAVESEVGIVKIGDEGYTRISKILTEYDQNNFKVFDLFGKCVEVRPFSGSDGADGTKLIALGEIGSKEKSELIF